MLETLQPWGLHSIFSSRVYIVRIKCEKHTDTQNKLQSIVNGLFPKGSKSVLPKNVSTTVFVKIIQFIAQAS